MFYNYVAVNTASAPQFFKVMTCLTNAVCFELLQADEPLSKIRGTRFASAGFSGFIHICVYASKDTLGLGHKQSPKVNAYSICSDFVHEIKFHNMKYSIWGITPYLKHFQFGGVADFHTRDAQSI